MQIKFGLNDSSKHKLLVLVGRSSVFFDWFNLPFWGRLIKKRIWNED